MGNSFRSSSRRPSTYYTMPPYDPSNRIDARAPQAQNNLQLNPAHDWSAFDEAFHPPPRQGYNPAVGATPAPVAPPTPVRGGGKAAAPAPAATPAAQPSAVQRMIARATGSDPGTAAAPASSAGAGPGTAAPSPRVPTGPSRIAAAPNDIQGNVVQSLLDRAAGVPSPAAAPNAGQVARATGQQQQTPFGTVGAGTARVADGKPIMENGQQVGIEGSSVGLAKSRADTLAKYPGIAHAGTPENTAFVNYAKQIDPTTGQPFGEAAAHARVDQLMAPVNASKVADQLARGGTLTTPAAQVRGDLPAPGSSDAATAAASVAKNQAEMAKAKDEAGPFAPNSTAGKVLQNHPGIAQATVNGVSAALSAVGVSDDAKRSLAQNVQSHLPGPIVGSPAPLPPAPLAPSAPTLGDSDVQSHVYVAGTGKAQAAEIAAKGGFRPGMDPESFDTMVGAAAYDAANRPAPAPVDPAKPVLNMARGYIPHFADGYVPGAGDTVKSLFTGKAPPPDFPPAGQPGGRPGGQGGITRPLSTQPPPPATSVQGLKDYVQTLPPVQPGAPATTPAPAMVAQTRTVPNLAGGYVPGMGESPAHDWSYFQSSFGSPSSGGGGTSNTQHPTSNIQSGSAQPAIGASPEHDWSDFNRDFGSPKSATSADTDGTTAPAANPVVNLASGYVPYSGANGAGPAATGPSANGATAAGDASWKSNMTAGVDALRSDDAAAGFPNQAIGAERLSNGNPGDNVPGYRNPPNYAGGYVPGGNMPAPAPTAIPARRMPPALPVRGIQPAMRREKSAISRGVGGARKTDRPEAVNLPRIGPAVINSGEKVMPNMAGGFPAVLDRRMQRRMRVPYTPGRS